MFTAMSAITQWKEALESWALPKEIIDQAEESPWIHPPALFTLPTEIPMIPSHQKAGEALPEGGSILDIGCGGGIAAFAHTGKVGSVIGVDHQSEMLSMFAKNAEERGISHQVFEGFWPEVASKVPTADVVTVHHVVYNVQQIQQFIEALNQHARHRVVIEMPQHHPLSNMSDLWKHFWDLDRPTEPTHFSFMAVLEELGIKASMLEWESEMFRSLDLDQEAHFTRIRLALPPSRENEVKDYLALNPRPGRRELATIWWDLP
jgi:SAM-dependent methyltransferase